MTTLTPERIEASVEKFHIVEDFFRAYTKDDSSAFEIKKTLHNGLTRFVLYQRNPHQLKAEITIYGNK